MDLVIVRHAIAPERDATRWPDDRLRPLSPGGLARGRKAALGLARIAPEPGLVLTSPLVRTRQTARILQREAGWPRAQPCAELVPDAPPRTLLARLAHSSAERIAIVGHEPHLSAFLAQCLPGDARQGLPFRKMGAALVRFPGRAQAGRGELIWFAPPKLLRALRKD
ncbi:MAG: histidine phosphatase family protein [Proteobacteria bacterium]|nr:histidine phosphatase family protein [Pseudomonadota bacterium]